MLKKRLGPGRVCAVTARDAVYIRVTCRKIAETLFVPPCAAPGSAGRFVEQDPPTTSVHYEALVDRALVGKPPWSPHVTSLLAHATAIPPTDQNEINASGTASGNCDQPRPVGDALSPGHRHTARSLVVSITASALVITSND